MRLKPLASALLLCATITLATEEAFACSCGPPPPVLDSYEKAHAVVLARVLSIDPYKNQETSLTKAEKERLGDSGIATFLVEKVYKGRLRPNQEF